MLSPFDPDRSTLLGRCVRPVYQKLRSALANFAAPGMPCGTSVIEPLEGRALMSATVGDVPPMLTPDPTFGQGAPVHIDVLNQDTYAALMRVQSDGKLLIAGNSGNTVGFLIRLNADGSPDTTFGTGGRVLIGGPGAVLTGISLVDGVTAMAVQADGKIVVSAEIRPPVPQPGEMPPLVNFNDAEHSGGIVLLRFNTDGTLDTSFGTNGVASASLGTRGMGSTLRLGSDGRIVVSVWTFGSSTATCDDQSDFAVLAFDRNGQRDMSFGGTGVVNFNFTTGTSGGDYGGVAVVQPDGKILITCLSDNTTAGVNSGESILIRLNADGTYDNSFGQGGIVLDLSHLGGTAQLQDDGKILLLTATPTWGADLLRYNTDGTLDTTFGTNGVIHESDDMNTDYCFVPWTDGRVILAALDGPSHTTFTVFDQDGQVQSTFTSDVRPTLGLAITSDGKVIEGDFDRDLPSPPDAASSTHFGLLLRELDSLSNDTPPQVSASVNGASTVKSGKAYTFKVTYHGASTLDPSALDNSVTMSGPNGFFTAASATQTKRSKDGHTVTVTYRASAPGGSFDASDNGMYELFTGADVATTQTTRSLQVGSGAGLLGHFFVDAKAKASPAPSAVPHASSSAVHHKKDKKSVADMLGST